jgi:tRNA pseudouridine55 synthase
MNGVLNINKPASFTSHDVVAIVRKLLQEKQIGHLGTLDPLATGVLPLAVGVATRLVEYASFPKTYRTTCLLGRTTDSCDITGKTLSERSTEGLAPEKVREEIFRLQTLTEQTPPMISALKSGGKKLYELARQGMTVERKARPMRIEKIEALEVKLPRVSFRVNCSAGTYVRVLCESLGEVLGVGGCMETLEREEVGPFHLNHSVTLETLQKTSEPQNFENFLLPVSLLVAHLPAVKLKGEELAAFCLGKPIGMSDVDPSDMELKGPIRVLNLEGRLCAIGEIRLGDKTLKPNKVFGVEGLL